MAIQYKLTETTFLAEVFFVAMVVVSTLMVWISLFYIQATILKKGNKFRLILIGIQGLVALLISLLDSRQLNNYPLLFAQFHVYFVILLGFVILVGFIFKNKTN